MAHEKKIDVAMTARRELTMWCQHKNIHPARVDSNATICLDCGAQVSVNVFHYMSGTTPEEQAKKLWEKCQAQIRIDEKQPEYRYGPEGEAH